MIPLIREARLTSEEVALIFPAKWDRHVADIVEAESSPLLAFQQCDLQIRSQPSDPYQQALMSARRRLLQDAVFI